MADVGTETPKPKTPERRPPKERDARETVIAALRKSVDAIDRALDLSAGEKEQLETVRFFLGKTIDRPEGERDFTETTYRHPDTPSWHLTTRERIPVEGLVQFLSKKIESGTLSDREKKEYEDYRATLVGNSREYWRGRRASPVNAPLIVRTYADRYKGGDYDAAKEELSQRQELVIPKKGLEDEKTFLLETGVSLDEALAATGDEVLPPAPVGEQPAGEEAPPPAPAAPEEPPPSAPPAPEAPPEAPRPPGIPEIQEEQLVVIGRGDVSLERMARLQAEEALLEKIQPNQRFFKRVWYRWTREYYLQKWTKQALEAMRANGTTAVQLSFGKKAAEVVSLQPERGRETVGALKEQVKEGLTREGEIITEAEGALKQAFLERIVKPVARGEALDKEEVQKRIHEILQEHRDNPAVQEVFGTDESIYGKLSEFYASDILEVAESLRAHADALDAIDERISIRLTNIGWAGDTTPAKLSWTDRLIRWGQRGKVRAAIMNPAVVGAASSLATFAILRAPGRALSTAGHIATPGVGMFSGGLIAAWRRNYELKVDRTVHQMQREYGGVVPEDARQRKKLERFEYQTATSSDLQENIREVLSRNLYHS